MMFIKNLIAEGEGQQLDFKYHISSASKIAKSLVAFANTDGGRLLIGVKDNGKIIGIESDEEIYMIQLAAENYCNPVVDIEIEDWKIDGKTVLEVYVPPSKEKPHYAKDETGQWLVYIRKADENLLANKVLIEVFKRKKNRTQTLIRYDKPEKLLLEYLRQHEKITFSQFCNYAKIPPHIAEKVLVNLVSIGIIEVHITGQFNYFSLRNSEQKHSA
ncbi:MAG: AlbA family DNA-binding domain-containing protein [Bacteroidia bacterium]